MHASYAFIDCQTHRVKFKFPNESILEWKGNSLGCKGRYISYLKAHKMIVKGCAYQLVRVRDVTSKN